MSATTAPAPAKNPTLRRIVGITKANALLMTRNRLTMIYAFFFPLLPLLLAIPSDLATAASSSAYVLLMAWLFPVYYNLLSMVVTRRDELVLKRMRTGEARDHEILLGMALPGWGVVLATGVVAIAASSALAGVVPGNAAVLVLAILAGAIMFTALALWTASWTRNAEAAQITSLPVLAVALVGNFALLLPDPFSDYARYSPTGALGSMIEFGWTGSGEVLLPLVAAVLWTLASLEIARRSMRWEPRT